MTTDDLEKMEAMIGRAVEKHVNGHIRDIDKKLDDHITVHGQQWAQLEPMVVAWNNWGGFRKTVASIFSPFAILIGLGSGIALIAEFFKR